MIANARLVITDGTSENTAGINVGAVSLDEWFPKAPVTAVSIWASSPYHDGKHLISKTYDNITDSFTVVIGTKKMDNTIRELRKFIKLLEMAVYYWTDEYSTHKFWLEVRGNCETNIRYAYVVDYFIPEINNPFEPPFGSTEGDVTIDELQINIEHTIWSDNLTIGTLADCVQSSVGTPLYPATVEYEAATCLRYPAVAPLGKVNNLTHAYYYNADDNTFSANIVGTGGSNLLPAIPAANDGLYVGILEGGTPTTHGEPFSSLVIHLGLKAVDVPEANLEIQYSTSVGFTAFGAGNIELNWHIPLAAEADLGIIYMTWVLPTDWSYRTINDVSAYWIFIKVTGVGANPTAPQKVAGSRIYTIGWSYLQISASEIKGDVPADINFLMPVSNGYTYSNIIVAARKYSRTNGGKFSPFIPLAGNYASPKFDAFMTLAAGAAREKNSLCNYGYVVKYTDAGTGLPHSPILLDLDPKTYAGRYRVFIRTYIDEGSLQDISIRFRITTISGTLITDYISNNGYNGYIMFDMGLQAFPAEALLEADDFATTTPIRIEFEVFNPIDLDPIDIDFYDIILIPVDDAHVEIYRPDNTVDDINMWYPLKVVTSNAKVGAYGFVLNDLGADIRLVNWDAEIHQQVKVSILGSFQLAQNEAYWIIFFPYNQYLDPAGPPTNDYFSMLIAPSLDRNQRYLLVRGDE
jgi:hypothetical protein